MSFVNQFFLDKSSLITGKQAQQSYRFILRVKGIDAALIQSVTTPKYKMTTSKYSMLDYTFNYPGKVEWQGPITFDIIQILDDNVLTSTLGYFVSKLYNSGYYASPMGIGTGERDVVSILQGAYEARDKAAAFLNNGPNIGYTRKAGDGTVLDLSKQKLTAALGSIEIVTLDTDGSIYDAWRLSGAFISGISPTDLTYMDEKISTIKVELSYDWANYGFKGVFAEEDVVSRITPLL